MKLKGKHELKTKTISKIILADVPEISQHLL
jgi:hypothetical protein